MKILALAFVLLASSFAVSSSAHADTTVTNCSATLVYYDNSPRLRVDCGGVAYYGLGTAWTGCSSTVSTDTLKIWETMATSALLSGKRMNVSFNTQTGTCSNGAKTLTGLTLVN
jgi:hypothetical protein